MKKIKNFFIPNLTKSYVVDLQLQRYKFLQNLRYILRMRYVALRQRVKEFISYRNETKWSYIELAKQIYRTNESEYIANKTKIFL